MPSDDRDQQFDRALARHLRSASPDAACPDAEILAAYHERALSLEEMAHWKTHIASCARCQETLALLEQTEPVAANEWEKKQCRRHCRPTEFWRGSSILRERNPLREIAHNRCTRICCFAPARPKLLHKLAAAFLGALSSPRCIGGGPAGLGRCA